MGSVSVQMTSLLRRRQVRWPAGNPIGQQLDVSRVALVWFLVDYLEFPTSAANETKTERTFAFRSNIDFGFLFSLSLSLY